MVSKEVDKGLMMIMDYLCIEQEGGWFSWIARIYDNTLTVESLPALKMKIKKLFTTLNIEKYFDFNNATSYGGSYPSKNILDIPIIKNIPEEIIASALDKLGLITADKVSTGTLLYYKSCYVFIVNKTEKTIKYIIFYPEKDDNSIMFKAIPTNYWGENIPSYVFLYKKTSEYKPFYNKLFNKIFI